MAHIGIAGAGLAGRLLAWSLAHAGHRVEVFDPAADGGPRNDGQGPAGWTAAGMLSPLAELETADAGIALLGWRSLPLWQAVAQALPQRPYFARRGSVMLAHAPDLGAAQRVLARLAESPRGRAQPLTRAELAALEPSLHGATHAWLLPGEGQVHSVEMMAALATDAADAGVVWHWRHRVTAIAPGRFGVQAADGALREARFDQVFDVRGTGAQPDAPVRGVRGEVVWLHAPGLTLSRPVRLLHPRHRVYIVPRPGDLVVIGASEIESEDRSPVSLKTAVELMAAAHSVLPELAEARIVHLETNLRPALPDNRPHIDAQPGLTRLNGLFRHGWLMAPALVEDALRASGLGPHLLGEPVADTWDGDAPGTLPPASPSLVEAA